MTPEKIRQLEKRASQWEAKNPLAVNPRAAAAVARQLIAEVKRLQAELASAWDDYDDLLDELDSDYG